MNRRKVSSWSWIIYGRLGSFQERLIFHFQRGKGEKVLSNGSTSQRKRGRKIVGAARQNALEIMQIVKLSRLCMERNYALRATRAHPKREGAPFSQFAGGLFFPPWRDIAELNLSLYFLASQPALAHSLSHSVLGVLHLKGQLPTTKDKGNVRATQKSRNGKLKRRW